MEPIPDLHIQERPANSNIEEEKKWLNEQPKDMPHLALIVVHKNAVQACRPPDWNMAPTTCMWRPKLDDRAGGEIQRWFEGSR